MPKRKLKILVLSHMFPNRANPHLGNQIYERAIAMKRLFDVRIIAPVPWVPKLPRVINPYWRYVDIPLKETIKGILVYHPRYFTFPGRFLYFIDALTYKLGIENLLISLYSKWKFDLIDAHQSFPDGYVATKIAQRLLAKPKVVITVHGADMFTPSFPKMRKLIVAAGLNASDLVIAVSKKIEDRARLLAPNARIITIPVGIKISKRIPALTAKTRKLFIGKFVILTVGNLIKRKGQIYLLQAVKQLSSKYKNIFCVVVGSGPELRGLRDFVARNRLEKHTLFTGAIPNLKAQSYFRACDILVLPSWNEALGIVYMEAMAYGKPVIGCRGEGAEELISNGKDGYLVRPRSVSQIAIHLEKLIKDPKLLKNMGEAANKKAAGAFRLNDRIKETENFFNALSEKAENADYKDVYTSEYFKKWGERFDLKHHKSFGIYFKKFSIKEPILDLGCGTGLFMKEAKNLGYKNVIGLDVSSYAVNKARKNGLNAYSYDGKKIPFDNNYFGTIFCYQVIEHIPRVEANYLLKECSRVLKQGGKLLLFSPAEYAQSYNVDPTHINFYPIEHFKDTIIDSGFRIGSFSSTMYLPALLRDIPLFSYLVSKSLYRLFNKWGTSIELEATKS
jgi:glycosyltransferase involved in cell wall biosynthesis